MEVTLQSKVQFIPGVGPVMADRLEKLGVSTVEDLLYYAPFRFDDFTLISNISSLQPGETVTIEGEIVWIRNILTKKGKRMQQAEITDGTGKVLAVWFNQPFLTNILHKNLFARFAGDVSWFARKPAMVSPKYEIPGQQTEKSLHTGRLVPVYSETEGLTSKWLRSRISYILEHFLDQITDSVPESINKEYNLLPLKKALQQIHFPDSEHMFSEAKKRLAFNEIFLLHLGSQHAKLHWIATKKSHRLPITTNDLTSFIKQLPFSLTEDQKSSIADLRNDFNNPFPTNRLLEGDVGAGKTVVAAAGIYMCAKNNFRTLFMAPTEILALQHFKSLTDMLSPLGLKVGLITGNQKSTTLNSHQELIFAESQIDYDVYVGTHALLHKEFHGRDIGLIIIDEQQRFGVRQRGILRSKSNATYTPHLLTMTATPIPRTIALTIFGNLDLSVINTMPIGRKTIKTWVVRKDKRDSAYNWLIKHVREEHGQIFILCPLIDTSENLLTTKAATEEFKVLKNGVLKNLRLGLLHGRMSSDEKLKILEQFRDRKLDVLVTTPVVEVGIDIPGATVMMIEAAERFGLGQLHQLRGRVGRNEMESYCFLFTDNEEERVITRLKAMETTHSGPKLADLDLKLRGPGDIFGLKQHGIPILKFADFGDTKLIADSSRAAKKILEIDPVLTNHPLLRDKLIQATIEGTTQD